MRPIIISLLLTGCFCEPSENLVNKVTLNEMGQMLNGHWKLTRIETTDGTMDTHSNPDDLEYFEFDGLTGVNLEMTDNHDGTFTIPTCQPVCRLKEEKGKRIIEYIGIVDTWELEIAKVSKNEIVLTDSVTKWTYVRQLIEDW